MRIEIDGGVATAEALGYRAVTNYGHFTSMQVRERRVRGLKLHLQRLESATRELFDADLDKASVRHHIGHALDGDTAATVRVDIFRLPSVENVSVMVTVRPPADMTMTSQKLLTVPYGRPVAHLKHAGTFAQIYYGRLAEQSGFDDALLSGPDGVIYEGAVANIGFVDSNSVVWPEGPALRGVNGQLLEMTLPVFGMSIARRPVRVPDLSSFRAVFVANSVGIAAVSRVDGTDLTPDPLPST